MTGLAGYLGFVLYVGSASNAATPAQRAELRTRLAPHLEQLRTATQTKVARNALRGALEEVNSIMGPTWVPDEETTAYILALIKER